jgi:Arc/MetJ-type ribon-helix-helix transcriptional regulator
MKVSVSLPDDDVRYLDSYARSQGFESRSAVLHKAVGLLRASELEQAYADAWASWQSSAEAEDWDTTSADGIAS